MKTHTIDTARDGGAKIRIPLDHPETDAIHSRASILLAASALNDREFGTVIKRLGELRKVDFRLARRLCGRPLPQTDCRPEFADEARMAASPYLGRHEVDVWAGWVWRFEAYVRALETKYFDLSGGDNDDI